MVNEYMQEFGSVYTEIEEKFTPKKVRSLLLSDSYTRLGWDSKAHRVLECGSFLEWVGHSDSGFRLHRANFCRDRLCPMCSWRRSYKIFAQLSNIMNYIPSEYRFVFLTLTVPNCDSESLSDLIDDMLKGWNKLIHRKLFKNAIEGYFRALEITRNSCTGLYHPHFHVVLAVDSDYFDYESDKYIKRDEWLFYWQQAMNDFTITQVDVRIMKNKKTGSVFVNDLQSAVAESAKYAVKSSDYIFKGNNQLMDDIVFTLSGALFHRRLVAFGGIFKEIHSRLGLDDCEDGDLVHLDNDFRDDVAQMIIRFGWSAGAYKLIDVVDC